MKSVGEWKMRQGGQVEAAGESDDKTEAESTSQMLRHDALNRGVPTHFSSCSPLFESERKWLIFVG